MLPLTGATGLPCTGEGRTGGEASSVKKKEIHLNTPVVSNIYNTQYAHRLILTLCLYIAVRVL